VRRTGGHGGEVRAGARESAQRLQEVLGERPSIGGHEAQAALNIQTVDDDSRSAGWVMLRPRVENAPVVVDRGFRAKPADESDSRHLVVLMIEGTPSVPTGTSERVERGA
jgi:hypothetical protein